MQVINRDVISNYSSTCMIDINVDIRRFVFMNVPPFSESLHKKYQAPQKKLLESNFVMELPEANQILLITYHHWLIGSFGNEPMQSCSVRRVSLSLSLSLASVLASVYSPPSDRFDHRSFISYKYMQLCP